MNSFEKYRILYIEDDEGVRSINSRFLKRMFKDLYQAKDGEEGFTLYEKYKPDIILTDIHMPKLDGISLSKKIRSMNKDVKIIIASAFSNTEYLLESIELDIQRYIIKPLNSRNLLPALQKAVDSLESQDNSDINLAKDFYFNKRTELFYAKDELINLNKKELLFLRLLVLNKHRIVTYNEIETIVWENEYMSLNSLRTTIGFLRKKIPYNCIQNISNMGYKLNCEKT